MSTSSRTDGEEESDSDAHQLHCGIAFEHVAFQAKSFWCMILLQMDTAEESSEIYFSHMCLKQDLALLEEEHKQKSQADQTPWRSLWAEDLEQGAPSAPGWVPMMPQQALLSHYEDLRKTGKHLDVICDPHSDVWLNAMHNGKSPKNKSNILPV